MLKKSAIGFVALLLLTAMLASSASAKNIDCTARSGTLNCPQNLQRVKSGPLAGKFILTGTGGADKIRGSKAGIGDLIRGDTGNDVLIGEAGNDVLLGGSGNDRLDGSGDNDVLKGGAGNDTLSADTGRDRLEGGAGNDTYVIPKGSHAVADGKGTDRLRLPRANPSLTRFSRIGPDLVIKFNGGEVRIQNYFGVGKIETIQLEGGRTAQVTKTKAGRSNRIAASRDDGLGGIIGAEKGFVEVGRGKDKARIDGVDLTSPEAINRAVEEANRQLDRKAGTSSNNNSGGNGGGGGDGGYKGNGEGPTGNEGCNGCP